MKSRITWFAAMLVGVGLPGWAQPYSSRPDVPSGTQIEVRTNNTIDMRDRSDGRIFSATVARDVIDSNGNVAIPRGALAELTVRNISDRDMAVDLESVTVAGRRYIVNADEYNRGRHSGVGANKRTGEFVGGGALLGTILGAVAGGGRGAAIGALAGGAAGAGTQVLTRGQQVRVPAESVLTFRLDRPLELGRGAYSRDNGYERDGNHYHRYDYDRRDNGAPRDYNPRP